MRILFRCKQLVAGIRAIQQHVLLTHVPAFYGAGRLQPKRNERVFCQLAAKMGKTLLESHRHHRGVQLTDEIPSRKHAAEFDQLLQVRVRNPQGAEHEKVLRVPSFKPAQSITPCQLPKIYTAIPRAGVRGGAGSAASARGCGGVGCGVYAAAPIRRACATVHLSHVERCWAGGTPTGRAARDTQDLRKLKEGVRELRVERKALRKGAGVAG